MISIAKTQLSPANGLWTWFSRMGRNIVSFVEPFRRDERAFSVLITCIALCLAASLLIPAPAHAQANILTPVSELTVAFGQLIASAVMLVIVISGLAWTGWRAMTGVQGAWPIFGGAVIITLLLSPLVTSAVTTFQGITIQ